MHNFAFIIQKSKDAKTKRHIIETRVLLTLFKITYKIMKQITLILLAFSLAFSCQKTTEPETEGEKGSGKIKVDFTDSSLKKSSTKGFFDNLATSESFEMGLNNGILFILRDDNVYFKKNISKAELDAKSFTILVPNVGNTDNLQLYIVVNNTDAQNAKSKTELLALMEDEQNSYNGTFTEVTTKAMRGQGFSMSGKTNVSITANKTTSANIELTRAVSKVHIKAQATELFASRYKGLLTVESAELLNLSNQTPVVAEGAGAITTTSTISQAPSLLGSIFQNAFYAYSSTAILTLRINAIYDEDKNPATIYDRVPIVYNIDYPGENLKRNGYYRINININGFVADKDVQTSITVKDWETPVSLETGIGE